MPLATGSHPIPYRTRQLSPSASMVAPTTGRQSRSVPGPCIQKNYSLPHFFTMEQYSSGLENFYLRSGIEGGPYSGLSFSGELQPYDLPLYESIEDTKRLVSLFLDSNEAAEANALLDKRETGSSFVVLNQHERRRWKELYDKVWRAQVSKSMNEK